MKRRMEIAIVFLAMLGLFGAGCDEDSSDSDPGDDDADDDDDDDTSYTDDDDVPCEDVVAELPDGECIVCVNQTPLGCAPYPSVAMDAQGNFIVVYQTSGDASIGERNVMLRRFVVDGPTGGEEMTVFTGTSWGEFETAVALNDQGGFVVVWSGVYNEGDGGGQGEIRGQFFGADGGATGPMLTITDDAYGGGVLPRVAFSAAGVVAVVWRAQSGAHATDERLSLFTGTGGPIVEDKAIVPAELVGFSRYGSDFVSDDRLVVVGTVDAGTKENLNVHGFLVDLSGEPVGSPFPLDSDTTGWQSVPSVAGLPGGGFVAAWASENEPDRMFRIYGRVFDSVGAPVMARFRVDESDVKIVPLPLVSSNVAGEFAVTWLNDEASRKAAGSGAQAKTIFQDYFIRTRLYGTDVQPIGGEISVSGSAPYLSGVTTDLGPDRRYIAAWGFESGGSSHLVARLIAPDVDAECGFPAEW